MIWQDILIMVANIIFSISLVPQVYHGFKKKVGTIKLLTSGPTTVGLFALSYAFFTLHLYLSSTFSLVSGLLWMTLLIQRLVYKKI